MSTTWLHPLSQFWFHSLRVDSLASSKSRGSKAATYSAWEAKARGSSLGRAAPSCWHSACHRRPQRTCLSSLQAHRALCCLSAANCWLDVVAWYVQLQKALSKAQLPAPPKLQRVTRYTLQYNYWRGGPHSSTGTCASGTWCCCAGPRRAVLGPLMGRLGGSGLDGAVACASLRAASTCSAIHPQHSRSNGQRARPPGSPTAEDADNAGCMWQPWCR